MYHSLPLVFVTVALSVVDMLSVGKASAIGTKVVFFYLFTTLCAALMGIASAVIFTPLFKTENVPSSGEGLPEVKLGCNISGYITETMDGSLFCTSSEDESSTFMMKDVNNYFVVNNDGIPNDDISLSDQLYDGKAMVKCLLCY